MEELQNKRWLVALDLSELDQTIVAWVGYLSTIYEPEDVYFIHVERDFEIPDYVPKELVDSIATIDETQRSAIELLVAENFKNKNVKAHIDVIEGDPFEKLIHWVKVKKIDLFISGRKKEQDGSEIIPHKLVRKLTCKVLFIPKIEMRGVKKILVPIDFSEYATMALQEAFKLAEKVKDVEIECLHIYKVPLGYYKTGKSYEDFAKLMHLNSTLKFEKFMKSFGKPVEYTTRMLEEGTAPELIYDEIEKGNSDLVIIGSKGQTSGALILLGSTAEKLIQMNSHSLTLVVKRKNEHIGFFEAIGKI